MQVAQVVSTSLVLPVELSPEMEAAHGCGNLTQTLVGGSEAGKADGEVGPLVPRECGGSKRASSDLS